MDPSVGQPPPPPVNTVPFEDTSQPFAQRFFRTVGMAFTNPVGLFSGVQPDPIGLPFLYGVVVGTICAVFALVWNMMFGGLAMLAEGARADEFAIGTFVYLLFFLLSPFLAALGLFVGAGLFHLALLILGDGDRGFAVTFRAVAYGNTPTLLGVVPICGGIVGGLWALVLVILAGKLGHGTDWWRAILAYFLPAILCCCLAMWLASTLGLLGILSSG